MALCTILLSWVMTLSDYQDVEGCPEMRPVPHQWLEEQACGGRKCRVLGWYPGDGDIVYLDDRLDLDETVHASIALHEIVHWVQRRTGALGDGCVGSVGSVEAEREAYAIQSLYLTRYGIYYPTGSVLPSMRCGDAMP